MYRENTNTTTPFFRFLFDWLLEKEQIGFVFLDAAATTLMTNETVEEIALRNVVPRMRATQSGSLLIAPYTEK